MTVEAIYPLGFLSDLLREDGALSMGLQRNDEMSGTGDGRFWAAELARPLWTASMNLVARGRDCVFRAREIDAKIRALGVNRAFLWADPTYRGPSSGSLASASISVSAISADRTALSFAGFPAGFPLAAGDRFSIKWGVDRYYLAELTEAAVADGAGAAGPVGVYPYPPINLTTGGGVEWDTPVLKAIVPPNGFTPHGYIRGFVAQGASLTLLQKV